MKEMMPCSAKLTYQLVVDIIQHGVPKGTGFSPMEVEFLVVIITKISSEVRWW